MPRPSHRYTRDQVARMLYHLQDMAVIFKAVGDDENSLRCLDLADSYLKGIPVEQQITVRLIGGKDEKDA